MKAPVRIRLGFILLCLTCWVGLSMAVSVKVANLRDLIQQSDRIFVGKCLRAVDSVERGIGRTTYTFQVIESIRGVSAKTVVLRQFGMEKQVASADGLVQRTVLQGMPRYRVGSHYLLFLVPESQIGLSSPAGLFQGAFAAKGGGFLNDIGNRNLTLGLPPNWLREKGLSEADVDRITAFKGGAMESHFWLRILKSLSR